MEIFILDLFLVLALTASQTHLILNLSVTPQKLKCLGNMSCIYYYYIIIYRIIFISIVLHFIDLHCIRHKSSPLYLYSTLKRLYNLYYV